VYQGQSNDLSVKVKNADRMHLNVATGIDWIDPSEDQGSKLQGKVEKAKLQTSFLIHTSTICALAVGQAYPLW
jgi:hypothetical protein